MDSSPQGKIDQLSTRLVSSKESLREKFHKALPEIQKALPQGMLAEQFLRIALTTLHTTPKLLQCSFPSLLACVYEAAGLGLLLDGVLGHAYLIPYRVKGQWKAQLQIGYKGYCALAYRSERVSSIQAAVVYSGDRFSWQRGSRPRLMHTESLSADRGERIAAYAIAQLTTGGCVFEVLSPTQVYKRRDVSQSYRYAAADLAKDAQDARALSSPWVMWEDEMWRKTAIRALVPLLPLSTSVLRAMTLDESTDMVIDGNGGSVTQVDQESSDGDSGEDKADE